MQDYSAARFEEFPYPSPEQEQYVLEQFKIALSANNHLTAIIQIVDAVPKDILWDYVVPRIDYVFERIDSRHELDSLVRFVEKGVSVYALAVFIHMPKPAQLEIATALVQVTREQMAMNEPGAEHLEVVFDAASKAQLQNVWSILEKWISDNTEVA